MMTEAHKREKKVRQRRIIIFPLHVQIVHEFRRMEL